MTNRWKARACTSSLALIAGCLGVATTAEAQIASPAVAATATASDADKPSTKKDADSLELQQIVVTGVTAKTSKFRTSYGVTTFNSAKLQEIAPQSTAALFAEVPGVWAESTGGETSGNLYVRGLPSNGGYKFVPLLEDGLPVYQEPEVGFMNADTFFRISPMFERTEFVRGGPSEVFYSNASAGAFNFINRRGTPDWHSQASVTWADYHHVKGEGFLSGPITDNLSFVVGGYYRNDKGQRPPGFTANHGGEIKSALTYRDGSTTASLYLYHLNDRTYFQTDLPFLNPSADTTKVDPQPVPGLDLNTGSLASPDLKHVQLLTGNGIHDADLGNGIHSHFDTGGFEVTHDFDNGWKVENRFRVTSGYNDFNGLFSGGTEKGTDVLSQIATGPDANPFWTRMLAAYPTLNHLELVYKDNSSRVFDPIGQNGNGLVANQGWWRGLIHATDVIDELKVTKSFDVLGHHDLTGGVYFSYAKLHTEDNLFSNVLTETKSQPDILNLVGVDANGNVLGSYTYNGFTGFAGYLNNVRDRTTTYAGFLNDNWKITDKLRVDFGARFDHEAIGTTFQNSSTVDLRGTPEAQGSTALALQNVGTLIDSYDHYHPKFHAVSWTVGVDYTFNNHFAVFGRYSEPERLPRTEDGWVAANRALQITQKLTSLEGGLKVNFEQVAAFVTVYKTRDLAYPNYSYTTNGVTGVQTPSLFLAKTQSYGVEYELLVRPWRGPVDINFQGTLAKSTYTDFDQIFTNIDAFGNVTTTHANFNGHKIPHIPEVLFEVTPSVKFKAFGLRGKLFGSYRYSGPRYLDGANTFKLPGYDEFSLGANLDFNARLRLQVNVQNLLNSVGMTEGGCSLCGLTGSNNALGSNANVFSGRPLLPRTVFVTASYTF